MSEIPAVYWMILIGVITVFVCLVLYYFAMLFRESTGAVKDSRKIIVEADTLIQSAKKIVDDAGIIVETGKRMIGEIEQTVMMPVRQVGEVVTSLTSYLVSLFKK